MKRTFWVYILTSTSGTLYVGMSNDIFRRSFEHREKVTEGFSSKVRLRSPGVLRNLDDVRKAINREKELKGWTRRKKIALIEGVHPRWQDLSKTWGWKMLMANQAIKDVERNSKQSRRDLRHGDPSLRSG